MLFSQNDKIKAPKTILVAPLDWGLGHAARCIPIIKELQNYPFRIVIAADGAVKTMLKQEFPAVQIIKLEGYKIKYSKNKRWFRLRLLIQVPRILYSIRKEHRWLKKIVKELSVSAVISDNRFGLYHHSIPSIYITHQLFIATGNTITDQVAANLHETYIKNYTQCWIPDYPDKINLAGRLSHPTKIPANSVYMGSLSRFDKKSEAGNTIDILIVLSGPEPQRSIFENILVNQLKGYGGGVLFVRGLPGQPGEDSLPGAGNFAANVIFKNHLAAHELNIAMQSASLIISRSGYTTIMDLVKLGRKAVLVPTPGQTEQEYLAGYLSGQGIFCSMQQADFSLQKALEQAATFPYRAIDLDMEGYKNIIRDFVATL